MPAGKRRAWADGRAFGGRDVELSSNRASEIESPERRANRRAAAEIVADNHPPRARPPIARLGRRLFFAEGR